MKTLQHLENENLSFSIQESLSKGWHYIKDNVGLYILYVIVTIFLSFGVGLLPFVGGIVNQIIIAPILAAGAILVTWQISKGNKWTDFGQVFKGSDYLSNLALSTIIQLIACLLIFVLLLMKFIPDIYELYNLSKGSGALQNQNEIKDLAKGMLNAENFVLFAIAFILVFILTLIWSFKFHFIVVYKLGAWPAMEASRKLVFKNILPLIGFYLLFGLILLISALPCGLGLLITIPWMIGANFNIFAQITGCDSNDINEESFDFMKAN